MAHTYTNEMLTEAVKESYSVIDVLKKLGYKYVNGYTHTKTSKRIKQLNLDISHFYTKNKKRVRLKPEEVLKTESGNKVIRRNRALLLRCLLEIGRKYECEICKLNDMWKNKKLVLHIDHIDGNPLNNERSNLRFLCPNCHSQTHTYNGRNKKIDHLNRPEIKKKRNEKKINHSNLLTLKSIRKFYYNAILTKQFNNLIENFNINEIRFKRPLHIKKKTYCIICGNPNSTNSKKYCSPKCFYFDSRKVERPSKEELKKLVWEMSTVKLAKKLGVSDKAIEKWCKKYEIEKPPRGYWTKMYK